MFATGNNNIIIIWWEYQVLLFRKKTIMMLFCYGGDPIFKVFKNVFTKLTVPFKIPSSDRQNLSPSYSNPIFSISKLDTSSLINPFEAPLTMVPLRRFFSQGRDSSG